MSEQRSGGDSVTPQNENLGGEQSSPSAEADRGLGSASQFAVKEAARMLLDLCLNGGTDDPRHCAYCRVANNLHTVTYEMARELRENAELHKVIGEWTNNA